VRGPRAERAADGAVHVLASGLGGAIIGLAVAAAVGLSHMGPGTRMALLALIGLAYGTAEMGLLRLPLPQTGRQVPAMWRYRFRHRATAALYGLVLGTGVATRVASAAFVGVLAASALLGDPVLGAAVMAAYGTTRALSVVIAAWMSDEDPGPRVLLGFRLAALFRLLGIVQLFVMAGAALVLAGR
jgi:hypothetical protein